MLLFGLLNQLVSLFLTLKIKFYSLYALAVVKFKKLYLFDIMKALHQMVQMD